MDGCDIAELQAKLKTEDRAQGPSGSALGGDVRRLKALKAMAGRCKNGKAHLDWKHNCEKARSIQIDALLGPADERLVTTAPVPWYPRGSKNGMNNTSKMVAGIVRTSSWHTSGGMHSTYSLAFGSRKREEPSWQQDLAALRASR